MKNLLQISFVFLLSVSISISVEACIFQSKNISKAPALWPSTKIEVCFLRPNPNQDLSVSNPLDEEYRAIYHRNMKIVRQTFKRQFNAHTAFKFFGFDYCSPSDKSPKIRMDLNGAGNHTGGFAGSVGPRSSTKSVNIRITAVNSSWPRGQEPDPQKALPPRVRTFSSLEHISRMALHETAHLLGLHHTEFWDKDMTSADNDLKSAIQLGEGPDLQSIMTRSHKNPDAQGYAQLSQTDIECLNRIADQSILELPSRDKNL